MFSSNRLQVTFKCRNSGCELLVVNGICVGQLVKLRPVGNRRQDAILPHKLSNCDFLRSLYPRHARLPSVRGMRRCAVLFILSVACLYGEDLPPANELVVSGDARLAKGYVRLTRAKNNQSGAVWLREKQYVRGGFDTRFSFEFTDQGGLGRGADGLAFVIQNGAPGAVGGLGSSGGFGLGEGSGGGNRTGIPFSLAVFFDSFYNGEIRDPSDNALHICVNGKPRELRWPPSRLAVIPQLRSKLKDGR